MNKKICSIMLSLVMTMSVWGSFCGTVMADTTDPGDPDPIKQEEQEPEDEKSQQDAGPEGGSGAGNAPEIDISTWPEASFTINPQPLNFAHGGYLDVNCEFYGSGILFGRVGEKVLTQELELNISRTAKIYKANGDEVCSVEVTNDEYNLSTGSELVVTRSMSSADPSAPFTFAVNVPSNIYYNLDEGTYTVAVEYQATWKKNIDYSAGEGQPTDDQTLPAKAITFKLYKIDEYEEGDFGNGLSWCFDNDYGTLYIYGKGAMPDYDSTNLLHRPWDYLKNKINRIYIEKDITSVGDYAFSGITSATILKFENYTAVKTIGNRAFEECGFTSLSIPDGVTSIGEAAFYGCDKISGEVSIPSSVTSIGDAAFGYCGFSNIVLPSSISGINKNLFMNCYNLTYVYIPYTVTTIGEGAFSGCSSLTDIDIPESVTGIGPGAFMNSGITSVFIPDGVAKIASQTFYGCDDLTSVTISGSVTSISAGAFFNCSKLSEVYCRADPDKLTWGVSTGDFISNKGTKCYVASRFFSKYQTKFSDINVEFKEKSYGSGTCGENVNWMLDGDGALIITGTGPMYDYSDNWNERTPWESSHNTSNITSVVIGDGVTSVGNYAFSYCQYLTSVSLPDSITKIGDYAFSDCAIRSVTIPDSVTTIGDSAFEYTTIESVEIPSSVTSIGNDAFYSCPNLASVTLSDGLESIGDQAFYYCKSLNSITIPGSVRNMGTDICRYCNSLTTANVCEGVTSIPEGIFRDCGSLKNVTISDTVTSIGKDAFRVAYYNSPDSIESIVIPNSVTSIASGAFYGQQLCSITIPGSVSVIEAEAFGRCQDLETVVILNGVTTIENDAFVSSNNIKSVTVPSSVASLVDHAFGSGQNLTDIYSYTDPSVWISFSQGDGYTSVTKLHVPENMVDSYRAALDPNCTLISETNLIGDAKGEGAINTGVGVHLYGYTLSLAGDIGVNFWMKLDSEYLVDDNYMLFTVNGQTQTVKVKDASNGNDGIRIFPCGVAAKEMTDVITAQFCLADGTPAGREYTYTVRDYANYILTHEGYSGSAKNLVKAMLNYGATSQIYFNYKTDSLANSVLSPDDQIVEIMDYREIVHKQNQPGPNQIKPEQVSLVLKSAVSLKLYFNTADVQDYDIRRNGQSLEKTKSGNFTIIQAEGITASELTSGVVLDFYDADSVFRGSMVYSPAKYCKLVLYQPTGPVYTTELKSVVTALYKYSKASEYYIQHPNE